METSDPEKPRIIRGGDDDVRLPGPKPRGQRVRLWLVVFVIILLVLSVRLTNGRCPAATAPLNEAWVIRVGEAKSQSTSKTILSRSPTLNVEGVATSSTSAAEPTRTVLKTFEVAQPVLMPDGPAESDGSTKNGDDYGPGVCEVLLMRHDFAWSYGAPFIGEFGHTCLTVYGCMRF